MGGSGEGAKKVKFSFEYWTVLKGVTDLKHKFQGIQEFYYLPLSLSHSSFRVAAKLAFSDRPQTPRGPKKGRKGPFGATHGKNGIDGLEATEISVVLPVGVFRIDS